MAVRIASRLRWRFRKRLCCERRGPAALDPVRAESRCASRPVGTVVTPSARRDESVQADEARAVAATAMAFIDSGSA